MYECRMTGQKYSGVVVNFFTFALLIYFMPYKCECMVYKLCIFVDRWHMDDIGLFLMCGWSMFDVSSWFYYCMISLFLKLYFNSNITEIPIFIIMFILLYFYKLL